jgi:hypothetical protein
MATAISQYEFYGIEREQAHKHLFYLVSPAGFEPATL